MDDDFKVWIEEHELYRKLAWDSRIRNPNTSIDDVLKIVEEVDKSHVMGTGGWLFESYIIRFGSNPDSQYLCKQIRKDTPLDDDTRDDYLAQYSVAFWFHLIMSIHKVNKFASEPLQMFSILLDYHGLSRAGMQYLALCHAAVLPRSLDRNKEKKLVEYDKLNQSIILEGKAVICFDNYNHAWGSAAMKLNKNTHMLNMNVTVCGISVMKTPVIQDFVYDAKSNAIPSIPASKEDLLAISSFFDFESHKCIEENGRTNQNTIWLL